MFVYQRKINNKDGIVFVSESIDQGKQLPIINGPAYVVYETEDGKIVAESVEFADGEIELTSKYFYRVTATNTGSDLEVKYDPLDKNYDMGTFIDNDDISQGNTETIKRESTTSSQVIIFPVIIDQDLSLSAVTSSGYTLEITLNWEGDGKGGTYSDLSVVYDSAPEEDVSDFYDKEVDGKPATDITFTCEDSTITVTYVYDENA